MSADASPIAADKSRAELDRISEAIIGAAHRVSSSLGVGFLEKVYENALALELRQAGWAVEQQRPIEVRYRDTVVGEYFADLLVEDSILVELKAAACLSHTHHSQCVHYLRATGRRVCLLLNFGRPRLELQRIVNRF